MAPSKSLSLFLDRCGTEKFLTDVRITWRDLEVMDQVPAQIPDLFGSQPLILHGRYSRPGTGVVEVEGFSQGLRRIYRRVVTLPDTAEDHEALGRLWARARIHQMERQLHDATPRPELVESIATLGLQHHLMTPYTSLVAVDSEVSNWSGTSLPLTVPVEMPEDVSYEGVFGYDAKTIPVARNLARPMPSAAVLSSVGHGGSEAAGAAKQRPDRAAEPRPSFTRLTLFDSQDRGVIVQADGKVFRMERERQIFVKTLGESELESIRKALAVARMDQWHGEGAGARIVVEVKNVRRVAGLPSGDASVEALVALLRSLTR